MHHEFGLIPILMLGPGILAAHAHKMCPFQLLDIKLQLLP